MRILNFDINNYKGEKIVVYGNRKMAYITTCCLDQLGIHVSYYVNELGNYVSPFKNIISVKKLSEIYSNENVIILFSYEYRLRTSVSILESYGIYELYSVRLLWGSIDFPNICNDQYYLETFYDNQDFFFFEDDINNPDKLYMYSLDAVVTERCSLKCENCSNLMQYYHTPKNLDVDKLKRSIDLLLNKVDILFELRILGGEPFMNMEFTKLVDAYIDEPKIKRITIFSNATIFPSDDVLEHLKHDKIRLRFSNYGKLSRNLDNWIKWGKSNNVYCLVADIDLWEDLGKLERHERSEDDLMEIYSTCECRNIPTIIDGKLYNCPYAANAANLGAMLKVEADRDCLEIDEKIKSEDIKKIVFKRNYLEACRYCNGRNVERARVKPFIQTSKALPYSRIYDDRYIDLIKNEIFINDDILLTVVIPVYNSANTIKRCLDSVLSQTYRNLEIIIVDDGSIDNSVHLCEEFAEKDSRIRLIKNAHAGVVHTRNTGILASNGTYIHCMDSDDYISSDYYANMMRNASDSDIIISRYYGIKEHDYSNDTIMSHGQGRFRRYMLDMPIGIFEGSRCDAFVINQLSFFLKASMENGQFWNKISKADLLKRICIEIPEDMAYAEDVLLYHLCLLEAKKVNSIEEYGYFWNMPIDSIKYSYSKILLSIMSGYLKIKSCLEQRKSKNKDISQYIDEYYVQYLLGPLHTIAPTTMIDYPYYNKLRGKKIILYGAGIRGRAYYKKIVDRAECQLLSWVDKDAISLRNNSMMPVDDIATIYELDFDYIIISISDINIRNQIKNMLISNGVPEDKII